VTLSSSLPVDREFCTLFDANYLPRGIALYRSLESVAGDFRLRVFCMDQVTKQVLGRLALPKLTAIALDDLEAHDEALKSVKPTRTQVEYCWTATPAICLASLGREPELEAITYVDADLMFFADPAELFDELGDDSILLTEHRYSPEWRYHEARRGRFNVQFMTFRRDERGTAALRWWRERCLEWCYDRIEDGKMGDQGYLNDWPERFAGVHVLQHPGGGLAPWNVSGHQLARNNGRVTVDARPLVFFHYHGLGLHSGPSLGFLARLPNGYRVTPPFIWTSRYPIGSEERTLVWEPYLARLASAAEEVRAVGGPQEPSVSSPPATAVLADTLRQVLPSRARRAAAGVRRAARRRGAEDSWKNPDVVEHHRSLVLRELADPEAVPPFRAFTTAIETLLRERALPDPARLLDFGCGLGHYGELLERSFPGRFDYVGCDYSPEMVEAARRQWPGREFEVNDLFANRLDLGSFDVILAGALLDVVGELDRGLDTLLATPVPHIVLHRQRITDGPSRTEVASGYPGQTTFRTFLNLDDLEAAARRHGRRLSHRFDVSGDTKTFLIEYTAA
jgi:SAM-dependent methyltransferase